MGPVGRKRWYAVRRAEGGEGAVEGDGCDDAVLAVVPAVGRDVGEVPDGAVCAVCTHEEARGELTVVGEGQDGPFGEVWRVFTFRFGAILDRFDFRLVQHFHALGLFQFL